MCLLEDIAYEQTHLIGLAFLSFIAFRSLHVLLFELAHCVREFFYDVVGAFVHQDRSSVLGEFH